MVGELISFTHEQVATRIPAGSYLGRCIPTTAVLGENGRGTEWRFVEITDGPLEGRRVYLQERDDATQATDS